LHSFVDEFHKKIGELPMAPSKKSKQKRFAKEKAQKKAPNNKPIKNAVHIKKAVHKKALGNAAKPVFDALTYKNADSKPRYYGSVTIYSDMRGARQWRVKPAPGRRDECKFPRTPSGWKAVIKHVKSLKQE
jgi:hypothetical protein